MKTYRPLIHGVLILSFLFFVEKTSAQENLKRDYILIGLSYCAAQGNAILNKSAFGLELSGFRQKNKYYTLGFSADFILPLAEHKSVSITNNLLSEEELNSEFVLFALSMVNHFDLNPDSKTKIFIEAKAGFRLAKFTSTHTGYLLFLKTEDEIYNKTSTGLSVALAVGIYIPLTQSNNSRFALQLKTGVHTGTPLKYIDTNSIYYENSEFQYGEEKTSNASYWTAAVDFIYRFR